MRRDDPADADGVSDTELELAALHGPAIPLAEICDRYFGLTYREACKAAALNQLGVPTFRMRDSQKAPVMVRAKELAALIDGLTDVAAVRWQRSQI